MTRLSKRIGDRLREARAAAGMTQQQVASAAGVSVVHVSRLERAVSDAPRRVELESVARVLGLTADDLMGLDEQPDTPADEDGGPSDDEINAAISQLLSDTGVMLAFMSDVREPSRLSRTASGNLSLITRPPAARIGASHALGA